MPTIVLAEDHQIVRKGFRALIEEAMGFDLVGETGDGLEAVRLAEALAPDVLVVDLSLPGLDGLEVIRQVRHRAPGVRIVVLSMHNSEDYIVEALRAGAAAYVLKESSADDLVEAVRQVDAGRRFFSAGIPEGIAEAARGSGEVLTDRYETLTPREREVLQLVAEGHTSGEVAERLSISLRTVETHRTNLMAKLGLRSQTDLVHYALQRGLIPLGRRKGR